jgi:hypothetical protein
MWDWVVTAGVKGMAAEETVEAEDDALKETVSLKCRLTVAATGGGKATGRLGQYRQKKRV